MKGRSLEVVETLERRNIDICCVQETRFRGKSARLFEGKESRYKFIWSITAKGQQELVYLHQRSGSILFLK